MAAANQIMGMERFMDNNNDEIIKTAANSGANRERSERTNNPPDSPKKNVFWDKISVTLLKLLIKFAEKLNFESLSKISFIGDLFYYALPLRKKLLAENLTKCGFGQSEEELKKMIKGIYTCQVLNFAEFLWMSNASKTSQIHKHFRIHGLNHIKEIIEKKSGGVIVSSHLGNWEMLAMILGKLGIKLSILTVEKDIELHKFIKLHRSQTGNTPIDRNHSALKCMRLIKKREIAGIMSDQHTDNAGVLTKFFGLDCKTTALPASLSLKTGCPIYAIFMVRSNDFKSHDIYIEPPIYAKDYVIGEGTREDKNETAIKLCMQKINDTVEKYIKMAPEQWFWFHKRWRP